VTATLKPSLVLSNCVGRLGYVHPNQVKISDSHGYTWSGADHMQLLHLSERIRGPETSRESGRRVERDGNSAWFVRPENADVLGPEDRLESRFGTDLERVGVPVDVGNISLKTAAEIEFDVPAQSFTSRFGGGVQDVWNKSLGDKYTVAIVYDLDEAWVAHSPDLEAEFYHRVSTF
jgi:hypothetical protein